MRNKKNFLKTLEQKLKQIDPDRLNTYINLFDRFLLYNIVANSFDQKSIDNIVKMWEVNVKKNIDHECTLRTNFLESDEGRLAKKEDTPDGEIARLQFLETLQTAKMIVENNLFSSRE